MLHARLPGTLLLTAMVLGLLPPGVAAARAAADQRLAVDQPAGQPTGGGQDEPLPGPEPNPKTTFAPQEYEAPWTWWLGVILTAVTVVGVGAASLGYWLLIARPRQRVGR